MPSGRFYTSGLHDVFSSSCRQMSSTPPLACFLRGGRFRWFPRLHRRLPVSRTYTLPLPGRRLRLCLGKPPRRVGGVLLAAAEDTFWKQGAGDKLEETNDYDRNVEIKQEELSSSSRGRKKRPSLTLTQSRTAPAMACCWVSTASWVN